jgi:PAS domain S-box-containing protein
MATELSKEEYAILVEQAPILIWRADLSMGCDYFNERWLNFTGRTMEQELGNGWAENVHPDDFDRCLEIYTTHFAQRKVFEMEYRMRRADGVYRWFFDRGVPYYSAEGLFAGYIGSCTDVTARIDGQIALEKQHASEISKLRSIIPLCSYCRKIRSDSNYWQSLETYVATHLDAHISHGVCPECHTKLMEEMRAG